MSVFPKKQNILTHDGKFHADDIFAVAVLSILYNGKINVARSRAPEVIKDALDNGHIIVDNGREYNPEKNIFDHHQEGGSGERESGVPYAGFGLIWKHFGEKICRQEIEKLQKDKKHQENIKAVAQTMQNNSFSIESAVNYVWQKIDQKFVSKIDATDTGYTDYFSEKTNDSAPVPDKIFEMFVPTWVEEYNEADQSFMKLVSASEIVMKRLIRITFHKYLSQKIVEKIYEQSADKRVIVFDKGYPWKEFLSSKPEPLFTIMRAINDDGYVIQGVPINEDTQTVRQKFPENWLGKAGPDLEKASGVTGAKFCHSAGFLAVASDLEGALKMCGKVIAIKYHNKV